MMNAKQDIFIGDTTFQRARPPTKEIPGAKIQNAARRVGTDFWEPLRCELLL